MCRTKASLAAKGEGATGRTEGGGSDEEAVLPCATATSEATTRQAGELGSGGDGAGTCRNLAARRVGTCLGDQI